MDWIDLGLELGTEIAKLKNKKLETKWKEKALAIRREMALEQDNNFGKRDMNKISHLMREEKELIKLFYKEVMS